MRLNDAVIGLLLLLFAAAMIAYTATFPAMPGQRYGSALFPRIIGAGLGLCGLILIAQGTRARRLAGAPARLATWPATTPGRINVALVLTGLIFYILFADDLGFIPTGILLLTPLLVRLRVRILPAIGIAVASTLVIHALFSRLLLVPLPWGVLQPIAW